MNNEKTIIARGKVEFLFYDYDFTDEALAIMSADDWREKINHIEKPAFSEEEFGDEYLFVASQDNNGNWRINFEWQI